MDGFPKYYLMTEDELQVPLLFDGHHDGWRDIFMPCSIVGIQALSACMKEKALVS